MSAGIANPHVLFGYSAQLRHLWPDHSHFYFGFKYRPVRDTEIRGLRRPNLTLETRACIWPKPAHLVNQISPDFGLSIT